MKHDECPHKWQAEAIDDERLGSADRADFMRHIESCADCALEWRELTQLREIMNHLPEASSSPFVRPRLRDKLIARVAKDGWSKPQSSHARLVVGLAAAAVLVGVLALRLSGWRSTVPGAVRFDVENVHLAEWSEEQRGEITRLRLSSGSAAFQVHRIEQRQRFLLLLPDGELEVHGTRFVVDVTEGRTERVSVTEGVVALRLQSQPERLLHAGEGWKRSELAADEASSATPTRDVTPAGTAHPREAMQPNTPQTAEAPATTPIPSVHLERSGTGETRADVPAAKLPPTRTPTADAFAAGVSAFEGGDYQTADRNFARFLGEAPADPRTEDAAFLRAVVHARLGDKLGAGQLAQKYLAQFPSGLRRKEAERISEAANAGR